jgi:hypothetical protein
MDRKDYDINLLILLLILLLLFGGGGYYAYGPHVGFGFGGIVLLVLLFTGRFKIDT